MLICMPIMTISPSPSPCYEAPQVLFSVLCSLPHWDFYSLHSREPGQWGHAREGPQVASSQVSVGLKSMLDKRPGQEGVGGSFWVQYGAGGRGFFSVCSPSPALCPQNVERFLETIGIKVSCLGAGVGTSGGSHGANSAHRAQVVGGGNYGT